MERKRYNLTMSTERGIGEIWKEVLLGVNMAWASPERIERIALEWGLDKKDAIRLRQEAHLARAGREDIIYDNSASAQEHMKQAVYLEGKLRALK